MVDSYTYDAAGNRSTYSSDGETDTFSLTVHLALQAIAVKQYDDVNAWTRIASDNGITDFDADAEQALDGRALTLNHTTEIDWQYDNAGNNTLYQEKTDGLLTKNIVNQYDQASHNTYSKTDTTTRSFTGDASALPTGWDVLCFVKTSSRGQELTSSKMD